jgi:hypothetical protein
MTAPMTEEEFFNIWQNQASAVHGEPEYRLYYDENGFPLFYSTELLSGNYIVVDQETYLNGPKHIRVLNGKLVVYQTNFAKKIVPVGYGQACDPRNVCVVVDIDQPHTKWSLKHQDPPNDQTN